MFKRHSLFLLITVISITACKKETFSAKKNGTWELRTEFGGWIGTIQYPPGNGQTWVFNGSNYQKKDHGLVLESGYFILVKDTMRITGRISDRLILNDNYIGLPVFVNLNNDRLSFSLDAVDAGGSEYQKIQ